MNELLIAPRAEQDMAEIFEYTYNTWGIEQAEKYQDDLYYGIRLILENNEIGKAYPYYQAGFRKLHINRHLIFYRFVNKTCLIVRVLHDQMDIRNQLDR